MNIFFEIGLYHYLILALILFCIGLWGVIVSRNLIKVLICCEFMLNAVGINFAAFASYTDIENLNGLVFALIIIVFASAEAALAAGLVVSIYKYKKTLDTEKISDMKG